MAANANMQPPSPASAPDPAQPQPKTNKNYKGFVAGVFSGIAKLSGALHPLSPLAALLLLSLLLPFTSLPTSPNPVSHH